MTRLFPSDEEHPRAPTTTSVEPALRAACSWATGPGDVRRPSMQSSGCSPLWRSRSERRHGEQSPFSSSGSKATHANSAQVANGNHLPRLAGGVASATPAPP